MKAGRRRRGSKAVRTKEDGEQLKGMHGGAPGSPSVKRRRRFTRPQGWTFHITLAASEGTAIGRASLSREPRGEAQGSHGTQGTVGQRRRSGEPARYDMKAREVFLGAPGGVDGIWDADRNTVHPLGTFQPSDRTFAAPMRRIFFLVRLGRQRPRRSAGSRPRRSRAGGIDRMACEQRQPWRELSSTETCSRRRRACSNRLHGLPR